MTHALKSVVKRVEQLPEEVQDRIAALIDAQLQEVAQENQAFTRLAEEGFAQNWENPDDAAYDNWQDIYGLSQG